MEAVQVLLIEILLLPQTDHLKALCPTRMCLFFDPLKRGLEIVYRSHLRETVSLIVHNVAPPPAALHLKLLLSTHRLAHTHTVRGSN